MPAPFKLAGDPVPNNGLGCDCCGRQNMKTLQPVQDMADGATYLFGPQCAEAATHPWASACSKYAHFVPHKGKEGSYDE